MLKGAGGAGEEPAGLVGTGVAGVSGPHSAAATLRRRCWCLRRMRGSSLAIAGGVAVVGEASSAVRLFLPFARGESTSIGLDRGCMVVMRDGDLCGTRCCLCWVREVAGRSVR
jgi:hypothetical protein